MTNHKLLNIVLSMIMLTSLLFGGTSQTQIVAAAPISPTDESLVPHYFGPYPNWANSPQVLADAIVTIGLGTPTPVSYGNPLIGRAYATDIATPPGTLGPVFVVLAGAALPAGTLNNFQTWNQASTGSSPTPSAGNLFHAYVLRPTAIANEFQVVYDSGELTVPALVDPAVSELATFPVVPGVAVQAGDVIAFYGEGIPFDVNVGTDVLSTPAPCGAGCGDHDHSWRSVEPSPSIRKPAPTLSQQPSPLLSPIPGRAPRRPPRSTRRRAASQP